MSCMPQNEHENNLPKNGKDLTLRINEEHSSESSSDDELELLTIKFKRFIKKELKNKNKPKMNKLQKKKKTLKAIGTK